MQDYLPILVAAAVCGLLGLLLAAARRGKPSGLAAGRLVFRHSLAARGLAVVVAFGVPLAAAVIALVRSPHPELSHLPALLLIAIGGALGAPLLWETARFSVVAGPNGLDCRSPWRGRQFFAWAEVDRVSYSFLGGWFTVRGTDGRTFRVPAIVPGLDSLLGVCEGHLPREALEPAKAGYVLLGRPFPGPQDKA